MSLFSSSSLISGLLFFVSEYRDGTTDDLIACLCLGVGTKLQDINSHFKEDGVKLYGGVFL